MTAWGTRTARDVADAAARMRMLNLPPVSEWPKDEDALMEMVFAEYDNWIPSGDRLTNLFLLAPALWKIPSPGSVGDTLEDVARDALKEYGEDLLVSLIDAKLEKHS